MNVSNAKYWEAVGKRHSCIVSEPITISFQSNKQAQVTFPELLLSDVHICHLKIVIDNKYAHSNVLLFDSTYNAVHRFEPLSLQDDFNILIDDILQMYLSSFVKSYSYHSHTGNQKDNTLCVAYCLQWVLGICGEKIDADINKFLLYLKRNYGDIRGNQDIPEYGPWGRGSFVGLGLGVLGGGLVGGLVGGPVGGLVGATIGGTAGYLIGSRYY